MGLMSEDSMGRVEVSPQVVARIAEEAVLQCYGVVGLATRRRKGVSTRALSEMRDEGDVVVRIDGGQVTLDLYIVVEYGTRISEVARNVMATVKFAVEQALGVPVGQVNVNVQEIHLVGSE